jgi:hypothetical protein
MAAVMGDTPAHRFDIIIVADSGNSDSTPAIAHVWCSG